MTLNTSTPVDEVNIKLFEWPFQSPDVSPIENMDHARKPTDLIYSPNPVTGDAQASVFLCAGHKPG